MNSRISVSETRIRWGCKRGAAEVAQPAICLRAEAIDSLSVGSSRSNRLPTRAFIDAIAPSTICARGSHRIRLSKRGWSSGAPPQRMSNRSGVARAARVASRSGVRARRYGSETATTSKSVGNRAANVATRRGDPAVGPSQFANASHQTDSTLSLVEVWNRRTVSASAEVNVAEYG